MTKPTWVTQYETRLDFPEDWADNLLAEYVSISEELEQFGQGFSPMEFFSPEQMNHNRDEIEKHFSDKAEGTLLDFTLFSYAFLQTIHKYLPDNREDALELYKEAFKGEEDVVSKEGFISFCLTEEVVDTEQQRLFTLVKDQYQYKVKPSVGEYWKLSAPDKSYDYIVKVNEFISRDDETEAAMYDPKCEAELIEIVDSNRDIPSGKNLRLRVSDFNSGEKLPDYEEKHVV